MILTTEKHISQYRHLGYNFEGPAFPDKYFWNRLRSMVTDKTKPVDKLLSFSLERRQIKFIHNKILKALKIDKKHDQLFTLTQGFIYSKDFRKMSLVQSYYEVEPLLKEISRRTKLKLPEIRNCLLDEIQQMLAGKLTRPKDLNKRMQGCYFVVINRQLPGRVYVNRIFQEMKKYLLKKEDLTEVNYFHGQTACLGQAKGIVRIINSVKDLKKMKQGNIMVSQMTNPDLVPAMKKASAIITDLGGITCHASIVSRELNIPCVIGTKMATQILKDGDKVQVDANRGDVNRIK
ncbi:hypothetical protein KKG41_01865 [Patescibacteria group bacterium]|nr:hypothetical protein [Patescibacteria group bacterium]MBU1890367.1 hypothetical protein [Patescibacteria group bacterium]